MRRVEREKETSIGGEDRKRGIKKEGEK